MKILIMVSPLIILCAFVPRNKTIYQQVKTSQMKWNYIKVIINNVF